MSHRTETSLALTTAHTVSHNQNTKQANE